MQQSEKKPKQILMSASLATIVVTIFTNPFDVVKVRLIKDTMNCSVKRDPLYCQSSINAFSAHLHPPSDSHQISTPLKHIHGHAHTHCNEHHRMLSYPYSPYNTSSFITWKWDVPSTYVDRYRALCDCIPFRSNYKALKYIIQTEGIKTLKNGLRQSMIAALLSNVTYLYAYEQVRIKVKKYTQNHIALPLITSAISRIITSTIIFPFDYWKTIQQGAEGQNKTAGYKLQSKPISGLTTLLRRDISFSIIYWVMTENIRELIKNLRNNMHEDRYDDKATLVVSNAIAGAISGGIAAILTLPLDVVKIKKQLYPNKYQSISDSNVLKQIYKNEGFHALFTGYRARLAKVTLSCGGVLTLYELFIHMFQQRHLFE